jgi:NACalpha-BTF3-like transcription factor
MRYHANKARCVANDAQASLGTLQGLQLKVFRVSGTDQEKLRSDLLNRTFESYIHQEDEKAATKEKTDTKKETDKQNRQVIVDYMSKIVKELKAAIDAGDDDKINDLIARANPRFEQINDNDPELSDYKKSFAALKIFYVAPAPAPAPVAVPAPAPAPAPVVAQFVAVTVEAAPAPAPVAAPAPAAAASTTGFDHNAFGDLTAFDEDDIDYVANKKGVDAATIRRARKLQMLDKQEV